MWITDFRQRHGLSLEELGCAIRYVGRRKDPVLRVSNILLENLETRPGYKTVPALANLIAETCGATAKQRDALTLKRHRGTWRQRRSEPVAEALEYARRVVPRPIVITPPTVTAPEPELEPKKKTAKPARQPRGGHPRDVYAIDRAGNIVHRYPSVINVYGLTGMYPSSVRKRCHRYTKDDEFAALGFTFRYADDWDAMSEAQRQADVRLAGMRLRDTVGNKQGTVALVAVDRNGNVFRFKSIKDASAAIGESKANICVRLQKDYLKSNFSRRGFAYFTAQEWDGMSEAQRIEYLKQ